MDGLKKIQTHTHKSAERDWEERKSNPTVATTTTAMNDYQKEGMNRMNQSQTHLAAIIQDVNLAMLKR